MCPMGIFDQRNQATMPNTTASMAVVDRSTLKSTDTRIYRCEDLPNVGHSIAANLFLHRVRACG